MLVLWCRHSWASLFQNRASVRPPSNRWMGFICAIFTIPYQSLCQYQLPRDWFTARVAVKMSLSSSLLLPDCSQLHIQILWLWIKHIWYAVAMGLTRWKLMMITAGFNCDGKWHKFESAVWKLRWNIICGEYSQKWHNIWKCRTEAALECYLWWILKIQEKIKRRFFCLSTGSLCATCDASAVFSHNRRDLICNFEKYRLSLSFCVLYV